MHGRATRQAAPSFAATDTPVLHTTALATPGSANRQIQVDPFVATGEVARKPGTLVVIGTTLLSTHSAFFAATAQGDDQCLGVAEDAMNRGIGEEASKTVDI